LPTESGYFADGGSNAADAAEIALGLLERSEADEGLLPVYAGLAGGEVLSRLGDVFGPVVNIASRLTSIARPGTVLIDRELAAELADDPRFVVQRLRGVPVRGYHNLAASRLRRHPDGEDLAGAELNPLEVIKRLRMWE
jgi:adenylate cyclase